ncbi:MAG: hypothetical protein D6806_08500 [Deltaproteobacteria bacterium]|nr:MAG: hypothetical protein D6806_08500 [Deltaproteobacteria bacterium]
MILCLSIDLDPLYCYREIYGLAPGEPSDGVTEKAARRFCQLAAELKLAGTLFVVGRTLEDDAAADAMKMAVEEGHEIGCHTQDHPYDLSVAETRQIRLQIETCRREIAERLGVRARGFRAPGYLLGSEVLRVCEKLRLLYDSSVLPSPAYQGLKSIAKLVLSISGRKSSSRLADPRETLAPPLPYRPDPTAPWKRGESRLVELPISTLLGVPLTGTLLALVGPSRAQWLAGLVSGRPFLCIELHGVDLMDIDYDGLDPSLAVQPDLKIPWHRKYEAILVFCRSLLERGYKAMTLEQAARAVRRQLQSRFEQ